MENFIQNISTRISISKELQNALESHFKKEEISKKEFLLKENQYCQKLFFLEKGTVRTFYYHNDKDVTSWFYRENQFFTSWYSFYSQQPSFEYIEVLENSSVYTINYTSYQKLIASFPSFERFARLLAEEQTAGIDHYSKGYMFMSAKDRYRLLLTNFPDIELRVKLGLIASFLGISQETLSRIRSEK